MRFQVTNALVLLLTLIAIVTSANKTVCAYQFDEPDYCTVIKPRVSVGCPNLCLVGEPAASCVQQGLACGSGAYVPCLHSDYQSITDYAVESGEFAVSVIAAPLGVACGTDSRPARLFSLATDVGCMADSNLVIAQAGCSLVIRLYTGTDPADCSNHTYRIPDVMCSSSVALKPVTGIRVAYSARDLQLVASLFYYTGDGTAWETGEGAIWTVSNRAEQGRLHWPVRQLTVCNEATFNRAWCGNIMRLCYAAGVGASEECNELAQTLPALRAKPRALPAMRETSFRALPQLGLAGRDVHGVLEQAQHDQQTITWQAGLIIAAIVVTSVSLISLVTYRCLRKRAHH